jgi:SOS-response transcriptional repressor LexA
MAAVTGNTARRTRRDNLDKTTATSTLTAPAAVDVAAIRVRGDAMTPTYCEGDVVLYRRPGEGLTLQPGDDVLVLLPGPGSSLQLLLRRLAHWDAKILELCALNTEYPPIRENRRNVVLCGKVIGRLSRTTSSQDRKQPMQ